MKKEVAGVEDTICEILRSMHRRIASREAAPFVSPARQLGSQGKQRTEFRRNDTALLLTVAAVWEIYAAYSASPIPVKIGKSARPSPPSTRQSSCRGVSAQTASLPGSKYSTSQSQTLPPKERCKCRCEIPQFAEPFPVPPPPPHAHPRSGTPVPQRQQIGRRTRPATWPGKSSQYRATTQHGYYPFSPARSRHYRPIAPVI